MRRTSATRLKAGDRVYIRTNDIGPYLANPSELRSAKRRAEAEHCVVADNYKQGWFRMIRLVDGRLLETFPQTMVALRDEEVCTGMPIPDDLRKDPDEIPTQ